MAHERKTIRDKIQTLLSGQTSAGTKVYTNREFKHWFADLPSINIQTTDENVSIYNTAPRLYSRDLQVEITINAQATEEIDDILDPIAEQVELVMLGDDTLEGVAEETEFNGTRMRFDEEGERIIGKMTLIFTVKYSAYHGIDPTTLEDHLSDNITYDVGENDNNPDTTDSIVREEP